jgi:hypothetical protein
MLGVFAEFETNLRRERQAEGIKAAKRKGVYRGRPPKLDMAAIQAKLGTGLSPTEIARELGSSCGTVYKAKAEMLKGNGIMQRDHRGADCMKKPPRKRQPSASKAPAQIRVKVPPPRNLTPELCARLRRDMMKACLAVAETHGLTVEGGDLADIDLRHSFEISFRVGIPQENGAIYSPDKAIFEVLAPHFGLEPSDYGRTFRSKDELFRIVAINPNRPKYPISAERVSDGRGFKFPAENVVMYLQRSGA